MGCDIHWVLETKWKDKWIGLISDYGTNYKAGQRWYAFFAELGLEARGDTDTSVPLRGLPDDISDLTKWEIETGCWDHSHSWLPLDDYLEAYLRAEARYAHLNDPKDRVKRLSDLFGGNWLYYKETPCRVVFAFDN